MLRTQMRFIRTCLAFEFRNGVNCGEREDATNRAVSLHPAQLFGVALADYSGWDCHPVEAPHRLHSLAMYSKTKH